MSKEYIEREAVSKYANEVKDNFAPLHKLVIDALIYGINENIPKADVELVRHGKWYFTEYEYFSCSECGESYYNGCDTTAEAKERLKSGDYYNYCPFCGAKME
jgi:hypothetical protein